MKIKDYIWQNLKLTIEASKIHLDFDKGQLKSFFKQLSKTIPKGCYYHYCAAIWKKFSEFVSKQELKVSMIKKYYYELKFLPYLNIEVILYIFKYLKTRNTNKKFVKFYQYYNDFWLSYSLFGLEFFNYYGIYFLK